MNLKWMNLKWMNLKWSIIILIIIDVILGLFYWIFYRSTLIHDFFPNLITGIVVVILAIIFVERIIEEKQENIRKKNEILAMAELQKAIKKLVLIFVQMWRASTKEKPGTYPSKYTEFLRGDYHQAIMLLDMSSKAPTIKDQPWHGYFAEIVDKFLERIDRILAIYIAFLDPSFVQNILIVARHHYVDVPAQISNAELVNKPIQANDVFVSFIGVLPKDFFEKLCIVIEYIENNSEMKFIFDRITFDSDLVKPKYGSGLRTRQVAGSLPSTTDRQNR